MKSTTPTRRDQIRSMLADLKMPGALEAADDILSEADGGAITATEAIEKLLASQISLRNNRRLSVFKCRRLDIFGTATCCPPDMTSPIITSRIVSNYLTGRIRK